MLLLASYYQRIKRKDQAAAQTLDVSKLAKYCVDAPSAVPAVASQLADRIGRDANGGIRRAGHIRLALKVCKEVIEALYNGNTAEIGTISIFEDCCLQSSNYALRAAGLDVSLQLHSIELAVGVLTKRCGRVVDWAGITDTAPLQALFDPIFNVLCSSCSSPPGTPPAASLCLPCVSALVLLLRALHAQEACAHVLASTHRLLGVLRQSMSAGPAMSPSPDASHACTLLLRAFAQRLYGGAGSGGGRGGGRGDTAGASSSTDTLHATVWAFMDAYAWRPAPFARAVVCALDGTQPLPAAPALSAPSWARGASSAQPGTNMRPLQGSGRGFSAMYTPGASLSSPLGTAFSHPGGGGGGGDATGIAALAACGAPFIAPHAESAAPSSMDSTLVQVSLLTHLALLEHAFEASIGEPLSTASAVREGGPAPPTAASLTRQLAEMLVVPWGNSATYGPALYGSLPTAPEVPWWLARVEVRAGAGPGALLQGFQSAPSSLQPTAIYTALAELCVLREGMLGTLQSSVSILGGGGGKLELPGHVVTSTVEECLYIVAELAASCPDSSRSTDKGGRGSKHETDVCFPAELSVVLARAQESASEAISRLHATYASVHAQVRMLGQVAGAYAQMWCLVHAMGPGAGVPEGEGSSNSSGSVGTGGVGAGFITTPPRPHSLPARTAAVSVSHPILVGPTGRRPSIAAGGGPVTPIRTVLPAPPSSSSGLTGGVGGVQQVHVGGGMAMGAGSVSAVGSPGLHKARLAFLRLLFGLVRATSPSTAPGPASPSRHHPTAIAATKVAGPHWTPDLSVPLEMALYDRHTPCAALAVSIWSFALSLPTSLPDVPLYPRLWAVVAHLWTAPVAAAGSHYGAEERAQLGSQLALALVQAAPLPALLALFPCLSLCGAAGGAESGVGHAQAQGQAGLVQIVRKVQERLHRAETDATAVRQTPPRSLDILPVPVEALCDMLAHTSLHPLWRALGYAPCLDTAKEEEEQQRVGEGAHTEEVPRVPRVDVDVPASLSAVHGAGAGAGGGAVGVWLDLRASTLLPLLQPASQQGSDSGATAGGIEAVVPPPPTGTAPTTQHGLPSWHSVVRALAHVLLMPPPVPPAPAPDLWLLGVDLEGLPVVTAQGAVHMPVADLPHPIKDSSPSTPSTPHVRSLRVLQGPYTLPAPPAVAAGAATGAGAGGGLLGLGSLLGTTASHPTTGTTMEGGGHGLGGQRRPSQQWMVGGKHTGGAGELTAQGGSGAAHATTPGSAASTTSATVTGAGGQAGGRDRTFTEPVATLSLDLSADSSSSALGVGVGGPHGGLGMEGSHGGPVDSIAPGALPPPDASHTSVLVAPGMQGKAWGEQAQQALAVLAKSSVAGPQGVPPAVGRAGPTPLAKLQANPASWLAIAQP